MAALEDGVASLKLPKLPVPVNDFISYFSSHPKAPPVELLAPYKNYEAELRKVYAQQPNHEAVKDGYINITPIFAGHESKLKIRARSLATESAEEKDKYILPLDDTERKPNGASAIVSSLKEFQDNFNLFSEASIADMDWSNVVAAGSAVTTALLPVPEPWAGSKRSLREYYHEHLAPASDVDLFLYGLNEEEAKEKIKQIESKIKDTILHDITTIRTKNAVTIASQYPTRHVQIVLRLYDSISQIIAGFDIDCACAAYDGSQVYASPRALVAFATQTNSIDLTRRSPSYENRLSKYTHRGFEVHWPPLNRSRIDPTIFERSFRRTNGLARLLVLERLPSTADRESYMKQRRLERGRPPVNKDYQDKNRLWGNLKDEEEDEVADWVQEEDVSNYHTMVVPYGQRFNASRINRLLYTKDLLLNAEWNKPEEREVSLHRHPCFFGSADDILGDCCGFCPVPQTDEDFEVAEEERKIYISGSLSFVKDDPGRQEIGSFNPITTDDWCEMAYVGNTQMLCHAIVDGDYQYVQGWCRQEGNDLNTRDFCGRTPLHLAVMAASTVPANSDPEDWRKQSLTIVQCLIDNGARMVARLADGRTALHLAAAQGNTDIVRALMKQSIANEEEEADKEEKRKRAKRAERSKNSHDMSTESSSGEKLDSDGERDIDEESDEDSITIGSFVKVMSAEPELEIDISEDTNDPDFFDINVLAWDFQTSPLHLAIIGGHVEMIRLLVEEYGADVLLPVKISDQYGSKSAILTLVLAISLPIDKAKDVVKVLLQLGATCSQGDTKNFTSLHYIVSENKPEILDVLFQYDGPAARSALNHVAIDYSDNAITALTLALDVSHESIAAKLLLLGATTSVLFDDFIKAYTAKYSYTAQWNVDQSIEKYKSTCEQPIMRAVAKENTKAIGLLLDNGANLSTLSTTAYQILKQPYSYQWRSGATVLDTVREKLKELRDFLGRVEDMPETLQERSLDTSGLKDGTYEHWSRLHSFQDEERRRQARRKEYEKGMKRATEGKGVAEKREAIKQLMGEFELIETRLRKEGAKTLREMYPGIFKDDNNKVEKYKPAVSNPPGDSLSFALPDLSDQQRKGYIRLFEAAWIGDIEEIKSLTLGNWEDEASDIESRPLRAAVKDNRGFSPFSIAVLRGHYKVGRLIVEITDAQYEPEVNSGRRERWNIESCDFESDSECDGPNIYSEIIDDTFTIENVTAISSTVKSRITPLAMINWGCRARWFIGDNWPNFPIEKYPTDISLIDYAVRIDDLTLVKYLLQIESERRIANSDLTGTEIVTISLFNTAVQLGRTAILAEFIKASGVGLPLDDLAKKSGVVLKEKPKYYQGLSVGGKKRSDWAQAGRARFGYNSSALASDTTPLLQAALNGNIESVQWFLSDAPTRRYVEFAAANKSDDRIRVLEQSKYGYEKTVGAWLKLRRELALHCAILWNPSAEERQEYVDLIKYLLAAIPESLEHKSADGLTPLHLAVAAQRHEIIEILLSSGANQRVRDFSNRNVLHILLARLDHKTTSKIDLYQLRSMLALFDKASVKEMLLERCTIGSNSALTPLALWLSRNGAYSPGTKVDVVKILMDYSQGEDLVIINSEGDLPLNQAVKLHVPSVASHLISVRPELLHRENATGRTPFEMANDLYLQDLVSHAPRIAERRGLGLNCELAYRDPSRFISEDETNPDDVISKKRTWEVCMEAAQEHPGKRRLVSLFEANEVAKRLATRKIPVQQRRSTRGPVGFRTDTSDSDEDQFTGDEKSDEVTSWLSKYLM